MCLIKRNSASELNFKLHSRSKMIHQYFCNLNGHQTGGNNSLDPRKYEFGFCKNETPDGFNVTLVCV